MGINLKSYFNQSISNAPLIVFRLIFGALMLFGILRFISKGWVNDLYIEPQFYFGYLGFEWVKPLEGHLMYIPFILLIIAALGILLGLFYRFSAILFFLGFTYVELLDKSNYLNHYYFVSLIAFLMIWVPANARFSLDVWRKKVSPQYTCKRISVFIFQFQLGIVYVFAGIAKLESDWLLEAQPLRIWLQTHATMPVFGDLLDQKWVAYVFSWFGCVYDLFIVFFLWSSKTRKIAYLFVVVFHFVTWYLLPIGVFPWVMIFSTLIFFSATFHEKIIHFLSSFLPIYKHQTEQKEKPTLSTFSYWAIVVYIFLQLAIPFRYVLYPGNLFWTEEGFRFSWRVMLMHKEGTATFYIRDPKTKGEIEINNRDYLTETQIDQMSTQPDMIIQYAQFLKQKYDHRQFHFGNKTIHLHNPSVHAEIYVSLNGRPSQLFVDKTHDLTKLKYDLKHRTWLAPFEK